MCSQRSHRAVVFVDANNWYHTLKDVGVRDYDLLDYRKICTKLLMGRMWCGLHWYVGQIKQGRSKKSKELYAEQRKFLAQLKKQDEKISVHLGRIEKRTIKNDVAQELLRFLAKEETQLPVPIYQALHSLGHQHRSKDIFVEKAVDVMLATDMVALAFQDKFDTAYLLSADGDYTHAVKLIQDLNKQIFPVSAGSGHALKSACGSMIHVDQAWLNDCYL